MRIALPAVLAACLAAPAFAEPAVKASMPAIRASVQDGDVVVRLDHGVLGSAQSMKPRTIVLIGHDASGNAIGEATATASRRMTYARLPLPAVLESAATLTVSVR